MSRSLSQPNPPDWQSLLLEAIQQRHASSALALSQRCVHRHGMTTLEALLERADAAGGQSGEARSWLFQLLKQGSTGATSLPSATKPSEGGTPLPASSLSTPALEQPELLDSQHAEIPSAPSTDRDQVEDLPSPSALDPDPATAATLTPVTVATLTPARAATLTPATVAGPVEESPASDEGTLDGEPPFQVEDPAPAQHDGVAREFPPPSPAAFAPEPARRVSQASAREGTSRESSFASVSPALDQAFAPLEIAFPPLPSPLAPTPSTAPAVVPAPSAPPEAGDPEASVGPPAPAPSPTADPTIERTPDQQPLLEDFPAGAAAPVPSFHVDSPPEKESLDRRKRRQPDRPGDRQAPPGASKALDAWRSWLPGPFRSRSRP